jgi:hypothetical protein
MLCVTAKPKTLHVTFRNFLATLLISCFSLTSCSSIMLGTYGIKSPHAVKEQTILSYAKKFNIPFEDTYVLDRSYSSYLPSTDTSLFKEQHKNHNQPLQALYYNNVGQLQSFHINCYAGGFPNLIWNKNGLFDIFPPEQQAPIDTFIDLKQQLKYFKPLSVTKTFAASNYDYVVIVFWNKFMNRQSKRLIQVVQENCKLSRDKMVKLIYVNNDNMFVSEKTDG